MGALTQMIKLLKFNCKGKFDKVDFSLDIFDPIQKTSEKLEKGEKKERSNIQLITLGLHLEYPDFWPNEEGMGLLCHLCQFYKYKKNFIEGCQFIPCSFKYYPIIKEYE